MMRDYGYLAKSIQVFRELIDLLCSIKSGYVYRVTALQVFEDKGILVIGLKNICCEFDREFGVGSLVSGVEVRSFILGFVYGLSEKSKKIPVFSMEEGEEAGKYDEYIIFSVSGTFEYFRICIVMYLDGMQEDIVEFIEFVREKSKEVVEDGVS